MCNAIHRFFGEDCRNNFDSYVLRMRVLRTQVQVMGFMGSHSILRMYDHNGMIGSPSVKEHSRNVRNFRKLVFFARFLNCFIFIFLTTEITWFLYYLVTLLLYYYRLQFPSTILSSHAIIYVGIVEGYKWCSKYHVWY